MDGWESRRRRLPGHDWCVIKLGLPGRIHGIEIDTRWFTGNQTPQASLMAAEINDDDDTWMPHRSTLGTQGTATTPGDITVANDACKKKTTWHEIVPQTRLRPGYENESVHRFVMPKELTKRRITHLRLNMFPDGGIARLKCFGVVSADFDRELKDVGVIDLAGAANGGRGLACSNKHYGEPRQLCNPGRGTNMGDGWETARNPNRPAVMEQDAETGFVKMPGVSDWCILQLAAVTDQVEKLVLDTHFFKGNYPESVTVEACSAPSVTPANIGEVPADKWKTLLPRTFLGPDQEHVFTRAAGQLKDVGNVSHVKISIFPDGGLMRCRVFGKAIAPINND